MFQFRLIYRNLARYPGFTFISLGGLMLGITCTLLMGVYIYQESSYDQFQKNIEKIYRVYTKYTDASRSELVAHVPLPMYKQLFNRLEGDQVVLTSMWQYTYPGVIFKLKDRQMEGMTGYSVDSNFFNVFSYSLLSGNPHHLLDEPNTVVLTESTSRKLFGRPDATGQSFSIDTLVFNVTGIIQDLPANTNLPFDLLFSENVRYIFYPNFDQRWWENGMNVFALINNKGEQDRLRTMLTEIKNKDLAPEFRTWFDFDMKQFKGMHLDPLMTGQEVPPVTRSYLRSLFFIALSVLLLACFNYIIFSISLAESRFKDTGIMKIAGANRIDIFKQVFLEGILLSLTAVYLAFVFSRISLPWFSEMTGSDVRNNLSNIQTIALASLLAITVGILVSLYPAFYQYRYSLIESRSRRNARMNRTFSIRKLLIIFQITTSMVLLMSEGFMIHQLSFMQHYDLGYNADNLYSIQVNFLDRNGGKRFDAAKRFCTEIEKKSAGLNLSKATITENIPGFYFQNQFKVCDDQNEENNQDMVITSIDENFAEVFGITLLEGNNYKPGVNTGYSFAILNETAIRKLGWKSSVDKSIHFHFDATPISVVGLFKDIHINSLQYPLEPVVYRYEDNNFPGFVTFRLDASKRQESVHLLQETWQKLFPESMYSGFFVREKYDEKYGDERRLISIIGAFSILSILLALTGVVALIVFMVSRRTKEVGIRKVNGAKASQIVRMFSNQLIQWVGLGFILACPISFLLLEKWLAHFPYHISITIWPFVGGGITVLTLSWMAVYLIIRKSANKNPVESLRYE